MNTKLLNASAAAFILLLAVLPAGSARAGTITVVDLPATGTDAASGISTNNHYVCAFDYGNNANTPTINGVPFTHLGWPGANNNQFAVTNAVDANFGGQLVISSGGPVANKLANADNLGQGNGAAQADGNIQTLYADIIYPGGVGDPGAWIQQEFDDLTPGHIYSLRIYYRYWGNTVGGRPIEVYFNGEGTQEAYSGNPLAEDAGGAHYIQYDFAAASTNVFCIITNDATGQAPLLWGVTLQDNSYPTAPVITQQPSFARVNGGSSTHFKVTASGYPAPAYQWYFNTSSNYLGATTITDTGNGRITGSASNTLTITNVATADGGYYFAIATNDYGAATSTIVNLEVVFAPTITSQMPTGSFSMFANQTETLSVTVSGGTQGLAYQWFTNGVADGNGTAATYYASAASSTPGETFQCIVTNDFGSATSAVVALTAILPLPAAVTSSSYSTNVLALNPAFYWPMHEQAAPAPGDIETNYGSLGALGNAYYSDWWVNNGAPGNDAVHHQIPTSPLQNDPDGTVFFSYPAGTNTYMLVPHTSPLTTLTPPFTIELWMYATNTAFGDLVSQDGTALNVGNANNTYGVRVTWGAGSGYSSANTIFQVYNGITTSSGYNTNTWHYVVMVCSVSGGATNYTIYVDNAVAPNGTVNVTAFKPDYWDPLTIGAGLWNNVGVTRETALGLAEVAIYTNDLSAADINSHWTVATNASSGPSDYYTAVLSDNPLLYYRMNSPAYSGRPDVSTWPMLDNYGLTAGNGVYMPGVAPGSVAGPGFFGLSGTNAMPGNGLNAFANVGFNPALNPTGHTPFSVAACFKGNPADSRYQNIVGHSDNSWRIALDPTGKLHFNAGAGGEITSAGVYNDGNWHQVVGAYNGTSNYLYVDGILVAQTLAGTNGIPGSTSDVLLGADPQYLTGNTGAGRQFAGNLCEVAFFNNALTAEQVQTLYDAIGAPVTSISVPVISRVGASDVFTVKANGSSPAYQWYVNTVADYNGATALTDGGGVSGSATASVTIANLQDYYFAVATNTLGSATSSIVQVPQVLTALAAGKPIWNQTSQTNLIVLFSDVVDPVTAAAAGNYALDNGASVLSAALVASNEVALTTSALDTNTSYTLTIQNVENVYGIMQMPSSTNLVVGVYPVNVALWVSADTGVTTNADGTVTQWNDLSGNFNNLYGATAYAFADPVLTNSASGQPVVYFDANATNSSGKAYGMAFFANDAPSLEITGDMSVLALVNFTEPAFGGGHGEIVSKTGYNNPNVPAPYDYHAANNGLTTLRGNGNTVAGSYGSFTASASISSGKPHVIVFSGTGNVVNDYLDGQLIGSGVLNANGGGSYNMANCADQNQPVFVGGRGDNTKFNAEKLTGEMFELMVVGSAITPYDVDQLGSYFIAKHNIVLVNTSPTNIVVSPASGNQVTLSWPVDHIGWQLQSNSVGLTATGAWFTVTGSATTNQMTITPDVTRSNVFYRLFYQP